MKLKLSIWAAFAALAMFSACTDDESFTTSSSNRLTFSTDTVKIDTVFSNVPSSTRSFWAFNRSGDGIRCASVRLENGASSGFRVNVDGIYLSESRNYRTSEIEVRDKDSIRVYVELTAPVNNATSPQPVEDNLIFTLESGVEQRVNLNASSWDATLLRNVVISSDSTLDGSSKPIVIYGGITVKENATLTLAAGTTLYFHNDAGIDVYGSLVCNGTATDNVTLRGDRLDKMFDYLSYDFIPGQWQGVHLYATSYDNRLTHTDIHGAYNGIVADSSDVSRQKLTLNASTIHNCQGYGLHAINSKMTVDNTQITNTLNDCVRFDGGNVDMNNCTLAQFYPFDSNRGASIRFTATHPLALSVLNTLITGYGDDVMKGVPGNDSMTFNYAFDHCIIRTPKIETADSVHFTNVTFENVKDTIGSGEKHFVKLDTENLRYDFHLASVSTAIGKANASTALPTDHDSTARDTTPDVGAYEYKEP